MFRGVVLRAANGPESEQGLAGCFVLQGVSSDREATLTQGVAIHQPRVLIVGQAPDTEAVHEGTEPWIGPGELQTLEEDVRSLPPHACCEEALELQVEGRDEARIVLAKATRHAKGDRHVVLLQEALSEEEAPSRSVVTHVGSAAPDRLPHGPHGARLGAQAEQAQLLPVLHVVPRGGGQERHGPCEALLGNPEARVAQGLLQLGEPQPRLPAPDGSEPGELQEGPELRFGRSLLLVGLRRREQGLRGRSGERLRAATVQVRLEVAEAPVDEAQPLGRVACGPHQQGHSRVPPALARVDVGSAEAERRRDARQDAEGAEFRAVALQEPVARGARSAQDGEGDRALPVERQVVDQRHGASSLPCPRQAVQRGEEGRLVGHRQQPGTHRHGELGSHQVLTCPIEQGEEAGESS